MCLYLARCEIEGIKNEEKKMTKYSKSHSEKDDFLTFKDETIIEWKYLEFTVKEL